MSEVFRCDYRGTYAPLDDVELVWRWVGDRDNGDEIYTSAIYCSTHCGRRAAREDVAVGS
jgi:hypothetical protein